MPGRSPTRPAPSRWLPDGCGLPTVSEAAAGDEQETGEPERGQSAIRSNHHDQWTVGDATGFRRVLIGPHRRVRSARRSSGCSERPSEHAVVGRDEPVADELGRPRRARSASQAAVEPDPLRCVPLARRAGRRQERGVGLDEQPVRRDEPGDRRAGLLAGPEDEPAEARSRGRARARSRHSPPVPRRSGRSRAADRRTRAARRVRRSRPSGSSADQPILAVALAGAATGSGGSPACRSPAARARFRRRLASWASSGENPRSESSPVSPMARTRGSSASSTIRDQPASSTAAASWGWTPTAASSHGNRPTRSSAATDDSGSQPGRACARRRPAGRRR